MDRLFQGMSVILGGIAFILLALGFMAGTGTGFAIIPDGSVGIMKTGTKYDMKPLNAGYHFFIPLYQTVDIKTIRPIQVDYGISDADSDDTELMTHKKPFNCKDTKGIPLVVECTVEVRPNGAKLPLMYRLDGDFDNSFNKKVLKVNMEAMLSTIANFSVDTVTTKREEITALLTGKIEQNYAKEGYFTLVAVNLGEIIIPKIISDKILGVQAAKQDPLKSLELITKAKNEALASEAKAQGKSNAAILASKGKAEAIILVAKAQSMANNLLAKSLTEKVIKIQTIEKWNGELPKFVGGNDTKFLMNIDGK
jgi:regulator of protease activity HflC (stomatin/prohibitin superfamily)